MTTATRYLGTCPVCDREQKLHRDRQSGLLVMVHHGYLRPGHGYIQGDCYGVGWQSFEESPDGTIAYVERVLQPHLEKSQSFLERLEAGTVTELYVPTYASRGETLKRITPEDGYTFKEAVRRRISETSRLVRQLTEDIAERTEKVARWRPEPVRTEEEVLQKRESMTVARRAVIDEARAARQAKRAALDAKQRAREQEALDLIEEYRNIFEQLAFHPTAEARKEAQQHWVKMHKRMNKKGYLHFYPSRLQAEEALRRLGLAVPSRRGDGYWNYANDLGWEPIP